MESEINIKLKSCPFCGGHATMIYDNQEGYYIYCDDCCIMTGNSFDTGVSVLACRRQSAPLVRASAIDG